MGWAASESIVCIDMFARSAGIRGRCDRRVGPELRLRYPVGVPSSRPREAALEAQRGREGAMSGRHIMTAEEIRRATIRISHEIVEKQAGTAGLALVGIQRRGVPLARRIADAIARERGRRDPGRGARHHVLPRRPVARRPAARRQGHGPAVRPERGDGRPRRRRPLHGADDPRGDGRARRLRAAAGDPPRGPRRPRPPRAADPGRPRRQERPDVARGGRPGPPRGDRRRGRGPDRPRRRAEPAAAPVG